MPLSLSVQTLKTLTQEINNQSLPNYFLDSIQQWLVPIANTINTAYLNKKAPIIISFNGAQGSGKSTITRFISLILKHHFKRHSVNISLDDFYLTKQERVHLAQKIHPLLKTRGVPGTHDIELAIKTLKDLKICSQEKPCFIPVFDKAKDDRKEEQEWIKTETPCDVILFEGWCNHAPIQTEKDLITPMNDLEKNEDPQRIWRTFVNDQLSEYQQRLFSQCDNLFFIKIPHFSKVLEWRGIQEKKLALTNPKNNVMDKNDLLRFIQHYERITRSCLIELRIIADTIIELDDNHQIKAVFQKN